MYLTTSFEYCQELFFIWFHHFQTKPNYFSLCNLSIATTDKILSHIQHHVKNFFSLWKLSSFELFQPNMLYTKSSLLHKLSLSSRLCATAKTILSHWDINVKDYSYFFTITFFFFTLQKNIVTIQFSISYIRKLSAAAMQLSFTSFHKWMAII